MALLDQYQAAQDVALLQRIEMAVLAHATTVLQAGDNPADAPTHRRYLLAQRVYTDQPFASHLITQGAKVLASQGVTPAVDDVTLSGAINGLTDMVAAAVVEA